MLTTRRRRLRSLKWDSRPTTVQLQFRRFANGRQGGCQGREVCCIYVLDFASYFSSFSLVTWQLFPSLIILRILTFPKQFVFIGITGLGRV